MKPLPKKPAMPAALSLEPEANNLASLTMSDALQTVSATLVRQWQRSESFEDVQKYGIRPIDRALFYGPPGNGKTVAAQLIASQLKCSLYRVRCELLTTSAFGGTQKNLTEVMDFLQSPTPSVVLWDECETIFPSRSVSGDDACSRELTNMMQVFWQRLDRWKTPQLFLLATNLIEKLDPALLSRIELQLEFGPPTKEQSLDVVSYWAEVFHEYGASNWAPELRNLVATELPESFRSLWQAIAHRVRSHIVTRGA